jgi:hypothetical protein
MIKNVENHCKIGKDRRRRIYTELETEGYFERIKTKDEKGRWTHDIQLHIADPLPVEMRTKVGGKLKPRREGGVGLKKKPGAGNPPVGPGAGHRSLVHRSPGDRSPVNPPLHDKERSTKERKNIKRDIGAAPVSKELLVPVSQDEEEYLKGK